MASPIVGDDPWPYSPATNAWGAITTTSPPPYEAYDDKHYRTYYYYA
jgi:hypothetical protein